MERDILRLYFSACFCTLRSMFVVLVNKAYHPLMYDVMKGEGVSNSLQFVPLHPRALHT